MRITDLLDKRSISLDAAPADKKATLDMAVELMAKSGKLMDVEQYRAQVYAREEEIAPRESAKALQSLTANVMQ